MNVLRLRCPNCQVGMGQLWVAAFTRRKAKTCRRCGDQYLLSGVAVMVDGKRKVEVTWELVYRSQRMRTRAEAVASR